MPYLSASVAFGLGVLGFALSNYAVVECEPTRKKPRPLSEKAWAFPCLDVFHGCRYLGTFVFNNWKPYFQSLPFNYRRPARINSRLVPVMFLVAVEGIDLLHFIPCQFKAEQIKILLNMVRVVGTGDDNNALL